MLKRGIFISFCLFIPIFSVSASTNYCEEPNCSNRPFAKSAVMYKRATSAPQPAKAGDLGGETLSHGLSGVWDDVRGVVTFPWSAQGGVALQLVAMSLPAVAAGHERFTSAGWYRELFFLDVGDGVPRLLSAYLADPEFQPGAQDLIDQSGQLWLSQFLLYQEAEELQADPDFYLGYNEGAAVADLRFVTNPEGEVLQVVVDIYSDAGEYQYSVAPRPGDRLNPSFVGYDTANPDVLYALFYFADPQPLEKALSLQRRYYVPSGLTDSALPNDFDAAGLRLSFLLEGFADEGGAARFGYSELKDLGYAWGDAKASSSGSGAAAWPLLVLALALACRLRPSRRRLTSR